MTKPLPYGRQWIDEEDIAAVSEILRSDFITTGPMVDRLEAEVTEVTGAKYAVAVNSGTSALHCAYFAAGLGEGDELITSPMTFCATANMAHILGAKAKFVDVEADTGNIDAKLIEEAITERTKIIAPVDYTGQPAEYDEINEIAKGHGIKVVADAAHSFGAKYKNRNVGTLADMTEISMHPVKPFTTGEGGMVLTDNKDLADRARRFRSHGITRDFELLGVTEDPGYWYYEMLHMGVNYRLTDIQGALGLSQLKKVPSFIARRQEIVDRYDEVFNSVPEVIRPVVRPYNKSGWHLYVLRLRDKSRRRAFFDRLRDLGLLVQVHYVPVHLHPYYRELGFAKGQFPVAEDFYERSVSIPLFPKMTDADVDSSIERILQAVKDSH